MEACAASTTGLDICGSAYSIRMARRFAEGVRCNWGLGRGITRRRSGLAFVPRTRGPRRRHQHAPTREGAPEARCLCAPLRRTSLGPACRAALAFAILLHAGMLRTARPD